MQTSVDKKSSSKQSFGVLLPGDLGFLCGKVFEGGQVTFLIKFENVDLVRSILNDFK